MQKQCVIQVYKTINKLLCNLSFAGQYNWGREEAGDMHESYEYFFKINCSKSMERQTDIYSIN